MNKGAIVNILWLCGMRLCTVTCKQFFQPAAALTSSWTCSHTTNSTSYAGWLTWLSESSAELRYSGDLYSELTCIRSYISVEKLSMWWLLVCDLTSQIAQNISHCVHTFESFMTPDCSCYWSMACRTKQCVSLFAVSFLTEGPYSKPGHDTAILSSCNWLNCHIIVRRQIDWSPVL